MNAETKERTCEQRINAHLESRIDQLLPNLDDDDSVREYALESGLFSEEQITEFKEDNDEEEMRSQAIEFHQEDIAGFVLSIDVITTYKVMLSWGGPSDFFELNWDGEGWTGGFYVFQDWFDGARREIDLETAERLADLFAIYPE